METIGLLLGESLTAAEALGRVFVPWLFVKFGMSVRIHLKAEDWNAQSQV